VSIRTGLGRLQPPDLDSPYYLDRSAMGPILETMHMINKRLLVGNVDDAMNPPPQVTAILMVAEEQNVTVPERVVYAKIPLKEFGKPTVLSLGRAVQWIETHVADHRLMVCCRVGMGRSVSVVIAYLCCVERMSYADAVKLVLTRRPGGIPLPHLEEIIEDLLHRRQGGRDSAIT
jgi:protein-tyrosine phosphatase